MIKPIDVMIAGALGIAVFVFGAWPRASEQERKPVWTSQCFGTMAGMVGGLNALPAETAAKAQLVTVPSQRNVGGWFGDPYCVVYPR